MSHMLQPTILLLKDGTDTSQGKPQLISNINACCAIVDTIRTTLGPRGMDKLVYAPGTSNVTISNDGATIMRLLEIVHPAAKTLVDIARSQDEEVGDGTTSVVVLAGELLKQSKQFVEDSVHPTVIIRGLRIACELAKAKINELSVKLDKDKQGALRAMLEKCAGTALNSKLIGSHKKFFAPMVVDAVLHLDDDQDLGLIGIKKVPGGSMEDSELVEGVALKKLFSYAGFEQQPKKFEAPKIVLLNIELELRAEKDNAEIRVEGHEEYKRMVDAEWTIIFNKLDEIVKCGAQIVLSKKAIGDLATQYFADRGIFCGGRVPDEDMKRLSKATGATVQTTSSNLTENVLGTCATFEERQIGKERYNVFSGCTEAKTATIILRGGGEQFIAEMDRSIHDAIMVVRRARCHTDVVAGGGAIEMEVSKYLREYSRTIHGKQQLIINAFAKALEVIPHQISENAGLDATTILNKLRQKHVQGGKWFGVDIMNDSICDTFESFVWEPSQVKLNSFTAATEAACLILSVDETVKNPGASNEMPGAPGGGMGRGMR
mmetsp:Transcript_111174/g.166531  ORF Transcript_111174/g.166531 Transcript_111174/m.166531 type:complete len:547 (-) Transcript_111174:40-1680(-)|eukprot:CAMPEP_0117015248 /NCGR_PEP_ID=MMETSP0472-20121206/12219_1 /TAXON_ID=693140 ORGANISM="Tiarina fusus, Strain LIS" /NCGR_SAMPLE_ID=MMETSP0472 /ASSEMBLY_ACC=CAM_ASM_000603 /LENGTH=546 /DNA_ID=CAMNT_0004719009 /DNA_START=12 /DNA_END=1652 /DNA_ORIENTATION=+